MMDRQSDSLMCCCHCRLPVPRSFRQEAASLNLEIVADEYIVSVDSVQNVPNLEEVLIGLCLFCLFVCISVLCHMH